MRNQPWDNSTQKNRKHWEGGHTERERDRSSPYRSRPASSRLGSGTSPARTPQKCPHRQRSLADMTPGSKGETQISWVIVCCRILQNSSQTDTDGSCQEEWWLSTVTGWMACSRALWRFVKKKERHSDSFPLNSKNRSLVSFLFLVCLHLHIHTD